MLEEIKKQNVKVEENVIFALLAVYAFRREMLVEGKNPHNPFFDKLMAEAIQTGERAGMKFD